MVVTTYGFSMCSLLAAKKARKMSKPLKRQMSSPNFHRKDKAVDKVSVLHSFTWHLNNCNLITFPNSAGCLQTPSRDNTPFRWAQLHQLHASSSISSLYLCLKLSVFPEWVPRRVNGTALAPFATTKMPKERKVTRVSVNFVCACVTIDVCILIVLSLPSLPLSLSLSPDQRRMVEIISHLTKIRFGDQEQRKSKDTKEVCFTESITPLFLVGDKTLESWNMKLSSFTLCVYSVVITGVPPHPLLWLYNV